MSRAGVGKNESSAGKRVIVAKGSGGGQGRAERHDATGGGYWRDAIGWSLISRQHVGHGKQTKYWSGRPRSRRAERERYCSANINASGREEDIGGGGLEKGRVMPRELLLPHTRRRLGVDSNVCKVR